jgi:hypothetical protein
MAPPAQRSLQRRRYNAVPYVAGGRQTIEMDREGVIHKLDLDLSYTLTNGASAPTGALRNWPARLIARVEVIVAGRDTVWSISGADLAEMLLLEGRDILPGINPTITAGNAATTAVRLLLPLEFTLPGGRRYDDCALDTRGIGSISLVITWAGAMTEIFGTTNGCAVSGVSLQVEAEHMINPGNRAYLVRAIDTSESPIVGNSDNFGIEVDKGTGLVYRSLTMITTNDNVAVNTVLDNGKVSLEAGNYVFENRGGYVLRAENMRNLQRPALRDGCYYLNFDQSDGSLSTCINTAGLDSTLKFILGVTKSAGVCVISTIREAVRPLKLG